MDLSRYLPTKSMVSTALWAATLSVASGHVAPAVDTNNRYLKLSPRGDRVRFAYTVFFGDIPGAVARQAQDLDRDGQLSEPERRAFGHRLAEQVAAGLRIEIDGVPVPVRWDDAEVGLGTTAVAAGSFAVDLVTEICISADVDPHHISLRDSWEIPNPGETEIIIEDGPGIRIDRARLGGFDNPSHTYLIHGRDTTLSNQGLDVRFRIGSTWRASGRCAGKAPSGHTNHKKWRWIVGTGVVAAVGLTCAWHMKRRRRTT